MNCKLLSGIFISAISLNSFGMDGINAKKFHKHFFKAINPVSMPSGYAETLKKKAYQQTLKIAVEHFRKRPTPALLADLAERKYNISIAENAVKGNITVVNIPYQFPNGKIDFLYDPTRPQGVFNPEWQWQLNRMNFWNDMALAYIHTRDEKFAAAFNDQIKL